MTRELTPQRLSKQAAVGLSSPLEKHARGAAATPWVFTGFTKNAGGTEGTLGFKNGANTLSLTLIGNYNPADFVAHTL